MSSDIEITMTVIDDLFERYILLVYGMNDTTDVFCEECESLVGSYETENLKQLSETDLFSKIVSDHSKQVMGEPVSFDVGL